MSAGRTDNIRVVTGDVRIAAGAVSFLPFDASVELLGLILIILAILIKG